MASAIPPDLRSQVEQRTGCVIAAEQARGGGGASRQGAEVTLRDAAGVERRCYLAWDARAGDSSRLAFFERETAILAALSGPFRGAGVKVAPLVAAFPSHLALLSEFVPGSDRFAAATDKSALARDFVRQLAGLHRLDARDPAFAALGDATEPPSARIRHNLAAWQRDNLAAGADPVLQIALTWLARNVPEDRGPALVLHGDAGPGNFLFTDDRVAALVDWELSHLGDPMEDLAQIWVRSLIQPFVPMREVFATYAQASGAPVDVARVKFHRLYFQVSFSVPSAVMANAPGSQVGATGTALLFGTMHRRVMVRAVAELAGIALADPTLPAGAPDWTDRYFASALDDLKTDIVPAAAANQRAGAKAKELARLVKFWRMRASHGAAFDADELSDIRALAPDAGPDLAAARTALARMIAANTVDFAAALQVCHNRTVRETAIMAEAMGALATTWYEPIAD
ncbi:phosphotransferase family protein [Novosphingobium sp. KCTC 2891]|uniref:phosphotransferase family protein n=1 Tax=unclassified Novosphingobium TaxID=2644732 RepID=UPI002222360D|nr:phosphotransferase family protein [Novosphingobium sp. KCTC 2891]MCW1384810.1 phosphotransferase family protein [Novosphingobium sp. KCTC 2891]